MLLCDKRIMIEKEKWFEVLFEAIVKLFGAHIFFCWKRNKSKWALSLVLNFEGVEMQNFSFSVATEIDRVHNLLIALKNAHLSGSLQTISFIFFTNITCTGDNIL